MLISFSFTVNNLFVQAVFLFGEEPSEDDHVTTNTSKSGNVNESQNNNAKTTPSYKFSIVDRSGPRYYTINRGSQHRRFGLFLGICTFCVAGSAAYYAREQALSARDQALSARDQVQAQIQNNIQMERQNDLEEVSQGLRSKESYNEKYKTDIK